jgi:hypothetical protein
MSLLNLSCKKATEMVEQDKIISLSFVDKIKLKIHLSICKACKKYEKQSQLIDDFFNINKKKYSSLTNINIEENPELKKYILKRLEETQP